MLPYNKKLSPVSRLLRRNMTPEEKHLWYDCLKKLPIPVKRQHTIKNYIVDFYIASKKIVIEIDGIQHTSSKHQNTDFLRDHKLAELGIKVLRYSNEEIRNHFDLVVQDILCQLNLE